MTATRLALAPPPVDGETLPSWLNRIAHANNTPLIWVLYNVGLADRLHYKAAPRGYGLHLTEEQVADLHTATGISTERIARMVMSAWSGPGGPAMGVDREGVRIVDDARLFAYHNWLYTAGSHYCPRCLAEDDGAWQLNWKLPWVFACVRHECFLCSDCSLCELRADRGRLDGTLTPAFPAHVPKPGHCHNPLKNPLGIRYITRCERNLAHEAPGPVAPDWLLDMQRRINDTLTHPESTPPDWWMDLRALTQAALTVLTGPDVEDALQQELPQKSRIAWFNLVEERQNRLSEERELMRAGMDHKRSRKEPIARTPPTDPHLLAPAVAFALAASDDDEALFNLMTANTPTTMTTLVRLRNYRASATLLERAETVELTPHERRLRDLGFHSTLRQTSEVPFTWDPESLPPLIGEDLYREFIAPLDKALPFNRKSLRRFTSIALYRAATGSTWLAAAQQTAGDGYDNHRLPSTVLERVKLAQGEEGVLRLLEAITALGSAVATRHQRRQEQPAIRPPRS